jgi:hypothetical protein
MILAKLWRLDSRLLASITACSLELYCLQHSVNEFLVPDDTWKLDVCDSAAELDSIVVINKGFMH